ncbi:hypothetical protein EW026_g741 [Hermanssonia centrifuga]|uniref:RRP12 HEAT domain-containing protein n=1 Tax=Hermanssonia centrifuga TaxID=98765 RepID=A0A4S4KTZ3_9APHY|nr:hypothetical protein EW026_g741 [Hermanssonia centrifuga]
MTLAPSWINVLGNAMLAYHAAESDACASRLGHVWKAVWPFIESSEVAIRKAAVQTLDSLVKCFTLSWVSAAIRDDDKSKSALNKIITQLEKALSSLAFARSIPDLLAVMSSLISGLWYRSGSPSSPTAAELLLTPVIKKVAELRVDRTFEYKEAADATLSTAMRILGPEVMLHELPLNLEPADRQAGKEPRAFLLPMLAQPHPSPLTHFVSYFVPLTERMFDLQSTAESEGRQSEAKVWSVLVDQIWSGLHGYCFRNAELKTALAPEFSQLLSQLLYSQPGLRPSVLKALKVMVDTNVALASNDEQLLAKLPESIRADTISPEVASANVLFLRSQVESWLAVLFNVFSTLGRDSQGAIGGVISTWASIADEKEIGKAYRKLVDLLKQNMAISAKADGPHTSSGQRSLAVSLPEVLESRDNAVQKRGYKILGKLLESEEVKIDAQTIFQKLDSLVDGLSPAAKKDRFALLTLLLPQIPSSGLHLIPSIIPEAVLGTKEPSEKARNAAFDLVVAMGKKMAEGGVVKRDLVDGMDEGGAGEATANVEEYLTMVAGGLAGASPHMISATITAISRLVFEFKDSISTQMHTEIFTTLLVFVSSANREIVKSSLGYIKLAIHTMSTEILRPHLQQLVPALLSWSHDHKNHFKAKVRHIFERMIRRFGYEDVYACAGEEEARKVLMNIKKRKDRAKRKKANNVEGDEDEEPVAKAKPAAGDAFEDIVYGSESELDDSDDEHQGPSSKRAPQRKRETSGARLRVDDDEPMDLLSGAASRITNDKGKRQRKPGQEASKFKTDDDTGKMIIDNDNDDSSGENMGEDVVGTAYREAFTSADGFTRGPNGRVKFNKDTKKRRRENNDEDVDMADGEAGTGGRGAKRRSEVKFGQEFKAKKAGGDVKKAGVDPYAYLPLSQAAKKKGRHERIGIAGKR